MIEKRSCADTARVLVTFRISRAIWADRVAVVGDFYGQHQATVPMVPSVVDPDWHVTLSLDCGRRYRFLYLLDDEWNVDNHADAYSAEGDGRVYGIVDTAPGLGLPGLDSMSQETSTRRAWHMFGARCEQEDARPPDPAAAGVRTAVSPAGNAASPAFRGWLLAPQTEITYTEFKTAPRAGQIQTATTGVAPVPGKLADGKLYRTVRVDDPDLLKDLEANKVNATGQVASRDTGNQRLMSRMPAAR